MGRREIDRGQAVARYAYGQLKQRIEALEEFERRGELSDRQLLIDAYEEQIQMVMQSDLKLALTRAVWLLGDCLDRIDAERVELQQLDGLYIRVCGIAEVLMWNADRRREFRALQDYMDRLKEMMRHRGPEGRRWYHDQGFFDDPRLAVTLSGDMVSWLRMRCGEEEGEDAPSPAWGDAEALREAHRIYDFYAAELGGRR